ncbi:MAG: rhamnulokinase family protein [Chthoniobacteraceae bacterium]
MSTSDQIHLGIDLGAESGRVMAGIWDGKTMRLDELHRFSNGGVEIAGTLRWDVLRLWAEIQSGLALARQRFGDAIVSIGVDTWGVDYVLMSKSNELLGLPYTHRDARTRGLLAETCARVPRAEIFAQTGAQFLEINTLFQLLAAQRDHPEILAAADCFLMIPDFLNWCLTGVRGVEFTNATTTQFCNPATRGWATGLLSALGLPTHFLPPIVEPGTKLGTFRGADVIAPATHDTGSAVAGVPTRRTGRADWAYLSSGTWSLLGVEVPDAILTPDVLARNLTNEGGIDGTYRLLKNIMGLWLVQQCKRSFAASEKSYDYPELVRLAEAAPAFRSLINPDDARFLSPADMPEAIRAFCRETGQPIPDSDGALVRCCFESLALMYGTVIGWIEDITGERIEVIHIVGGGSRNALLNQFTADACGRVVFAGPVEATVFGNVLVQARARGEIGSLDEMREVVRASGGVTQFDPKEVEAWSEPRARFDRLIERKS